VDPLVDCGLNATYYTDYFTGTSATRIDTTLHLPFGNTAFFAVPYNVPLPGASSNSSAPLKTATWTGTIQVPTEDDYTFYVSCDNQAWVFVDGNQLIYRATGGPGPVQEFQASSSFHMKANHRYKFEVRYEEDGVGSPSHLIVKWYTSNNPSPIDIPSCSMHTDK
jgi:hypothetical protein